MNKSIVDFIDKQKIASVCCLDEEKNPYCFSIFYVFDHIDRRLYFKSSASSNHAQYLFDHRKVAGTIVPDKLNILAIRGIQFTGTILCDNAALSHHATIEYHKRIPMALTMPGEVWVIQLETVKLTDNTISFGHKVCWQREDLYEDIC